MPLLKIPTTNAWLEAVMADFDSFLLDHASCEKKASSMAMTFVSHYPDRVALVKAMTDLAVEELTHFKEVLRLILNRNLQLKGDQKDPYVSRLFTLTRKGSSHYFLDRLLLASIIEARGHERFGMIADALPNGQEKQFYKAITRSEGRHLELFYELALEYFPKPQVKERLESLLTAEAGIITDLPPRAALH